MGKIKHFVLDNPAFSLETLCQNEEHPDYIRNDTNYFRFKRSYSMANKFAKSGKWEISADDPEQKLDCHQVHVRVLDDFFEEDEVRDFADFLAQCDNMMFFGNKSGETSFVAGVSNVYVPASAQGK